jgi:protein-disulfide isomerase
LIIKCINIEIQHFHGCPNSPILIERVNAAIKDLDNIDYKEVLVDSNEMAEELKFRGSPTLLINGEDFEKHPEPENTALACRYYRNGIPSIEEIEKKILEAGKLEI